MIIRREMLQAVLPATTSEEKRYFLDGVQAEPAKHRVVATNGHVLLIATDREPQADADFPIVPSAPFTEDPSSAFIPSDICKAMIGTMPKKSTIPTLRSAQLSRNGSETTATIAATDLQSPRVATLSNDQQFPSYDRVLPAADRPEITLSLSVAVLKTLLDAANAISPKGSRRPTVHTITFGIPVTDAGKIVDTAITIKATSAEVELTGVAMPCRV
jgi:DNA polymerase III sliding clamp (beta) subunit (PCNA family)